VENSAEPTSSLQPNLHAPNLHVEQRKFFRFPMDGEAMLSLGDAGGIVRCRMIDLSLEGCRLRREAEITARIGMKVEVVFRLSEIVYRLVGELAWVAKNRIVGVRFGAVPARQRKDLARYLSNLKAKMEALAAAAQEKPRDSSAEGSEKKEPEGAEPVAADAESATAATEPAATKKPHERRGATRHKVDSYARLHLLSLHVKARGKVLDVSMGGCRMVLDEVRPVGAYRRVEIEFFIDGLPLLLPGVTQMMYDNRTVGIRFVEMTERKREQLCTVIEELEQRTNQTGTTNLSA
jgi:c-di-GMP-binding flagellar brake protein YcgR